MASVVRNLASAVVVVGVALALGFRPDAGPADWAGLVAFAVLAVLTFTWLSVALGLVLSVEASQSVNFLFLFVPYLSSGFVPSYHAVAADGFAENQPFTPVIETFRGLLAGAPDATTALTAVAWLAGFLVASCTAAPCSTADGRPADPPRSSPGPPARPSRWSWCVRSTGRTTTTCSRHREGLLGTAATHVRAPSGRMKP